MMDFNFFSPYLKEKRNKQLKKIYMIAVGSMLAVSLLIFTGLNAYQVYRYKDEIGKVESYLNSAKTIELLNKYEDTKKKTELTKLYLDKVSAIDAAIKQNDTLSTDLLDKLSSAMPKESFLLSMSISGKNVELQYMVSNISSAAELEHNLKALDVFDKVHINVVNFEVNDTVNVSCTLKDVSSR